MDERLEYGLGAVSEGALADDSGRGRLWAGTGECEDAYDD